MSYVANRSGNLLAVGWASPEVGDLTSLVEDVIEHRLRCGEPVAYLAILDEAAIEAFALMPRTALTWVATEMLPHVARFVIVLESHGFAASIVRSTLTAVALLHARRRGIVTFVSDVAEGIAALEGSCKDTPQRVRELVWSLRGETLERAG